jgi:hypothetical protein
MVDDEHLLLWNDRDDGRGWDAPDPMPARPYFEHRRVVQVLVRQDPLDCAVSAA